ncbi:MAG: hypothetical protein IJR68_10645 [Fretibacterium sp.]|nr:hypothetical protein [Fretibacterium sp.]
MKGKRLYLIVQTVLCVLLAVLLAAGTVILYREGAARKAERPLEWIYTREKSAEKLAAVAPVFLVFLTLTAAGLFLVSAQRRAVWVGNKSARGVKIDRELLASRPLQPGRTMKRVRMALILAAIALIAAGVLNGSAHDVFYKAVKICTECVGLG